MFACMPLTIQNILVCNIVKSLNILTGKKTKRINEKTIQIDCNEGLRWYTIQPVLFETG